MKRNGMVSPEALSPPSNFNAIPVGEYRPMTESHRKATIPEGGVLYQASFFFCTVKMVGDIRGGGPVYAETVVDRDSGISFAKLYSRRNSIDGVDILASRVLPYFCRQGVPIQEIRTQNTAEYCGLAPRHPYESFLAASHIQHAVVRGADDPFYYLCEQFHWFLAKEFLQPALRTSFDISLAKLQKNLDGFLEIFNSGKFLRKIWLE